ncbi:MAG: hypothetical protein ACC645_23365, partial [Pirellulales bacterium]
LGILALLSVGLIGLCQWALHRVQPYYQAALVIDTQTLQMSSRRLESRVTALASMAQQSAPWEALFTDNDVNGWLAVALEKKFPGWLPENISDLRIAFTENCLRVGFRYQDTHYDTVVSIRMVPFVTETNVLAIRLEEAHAGALPIPLEKVVQVCRAEARARNIPLQWARQANRPIALLPVEHFLSTETWRRHLQTVELSAGQLLLAGSSEAIEPNPAAGKGPQ